jgi:4-amino-4-deoxy-L-arabinose transferase-like glycosyltransferase
MYVYFSFSGGLAHRYYFSMLAPSVAALTGVGIYFMMNINKNSALRWIFPALLTATAVGQIYIQYLYKDWIKNILPVCVVIFAGATLISVLSVHLKKSSKPLIICTLTLFILPSVWSATPMVYGNNNQLPIAGPELAGRSDRFANTENIQTLVDFLTTNRNGSQFLAAAPSAMNMGAQLIIGSGEAVMVLGGFNGNDKILTVEQFADAVKAGKVKYAVTGVQGNIQNPAIRPGQLTGPATGQPAGGKPAGPLLQNDTIASTYNVIAWIVRNGKIVNQALWNPNGTIKGVTLYQLPQ